MRITATRAAKEFNLYLADKHAQSSRTGTAFKVEFSKLTEQINEFRMSRYKLLDPSEVPEVAEIEAELRRIWSLKASETRKAKAEAEIKRQQEAIERAKQYELPL